MFDAPMPPPVNPPALVRRWCDANGCYVVRGVVNPIPNAPQAAPMPMPAAVEAMPFPRVRAVTEFVFRPFRNILIFAKTHRPRIFFK